MFEKNAALAEAYYAAMSNKDLSGVAHCLHPDVQFLAPLAEKAGKEAFLETIKPFMAFFKSLKVRATCSSEAQATVVYDLDCPAGLIRTATLLTFEGNLISRIELFYDARPFEKK